LIKHVLPLLALELPDTQFLIYGSDIPLELIDYSKGNSRVVVKGWIADVATVFDTCRVFVAPLQSGAGIKGKVISALAAGVPSVLSPTAAEGIPVVDGFHSAVAVTPEQWVKKIVQLYTCEASWSAMSVAAHSLAAEQYGFEKAQREMLSILKNLFSASAPV
jgi:glycosyltransferase involved in cell wall biosynthesis